MEEKKVLKVGDLKIIDNGDLGFSIMVDTEKKKNVVKAFFNKEGEKALVKWLLEKKKQFKPKKVNKLSGCNEKINYFIDRACSDSKCRSENI